MDYEIKKEAKDKIFNAKNRIDCDLDIDPETKLNLHYDLDRLLHYVDNNDDDITTFFRSTREIIHTFMNDYYMKTQRIFRPLTDLVIDIQKVQNHWEKVLSMHSDECDSNGSCNSFSR